MSLDRRLLRRAREKLEEKKREHAEIMALRLDEVYSECPRVRALDREIQATVIDAVSLALKHGGDPQAAIENIGEENMYLQSERARALAEAGFPYGYLDNEYLCAKCRDTGYVGSGICSCLMELYKKEQKASLSSLLKLGDETFDTFDLSWYDDTPDPRTGISPRNNMEFIYETCVEHARKFGKNSCNLFLNGPPGLGKTFLSACIARVVSDNGYSVVYDMASSIFSKFEDEKFSKSFDISSAREDIRRCLECDLLIMDDLGTEMTTSFTISALYEIINTRLMSGKKTVINSNLTPDELGDRYSPQIMSRLEGEYLVLTFYGRDIRLLKKSF